MRQVIAYRANKILYNFFKSNGLRGRVILPANICNEVVELFRYMGNELCFVDIDRETLCLDWSLVRTIANQVDAVLAVHAYGIEDRFDIEFSILRTINPKIVIVDDKCLCIPKLVDLSSAADLVLYSTGGKKQVDLGRGGIGYVADGWNYEDVPVEENCILSNAQWSLDIETIEEQTKSVLAHKSRLNAIYMSELPPQIQLIGHSQWRFNIIVTNKQEIMKAIFDAGLYASGHYSPQSDQCPNAQWCYEYIINLFNDFYFTERQAYKICDIINKNRI